MFVQWGKLTVTCQQLAYLHRDTEGHARDYKLSLNNFSLADNNKSLSDSQKDAKVCKRKNINAVIPYFCDILNLALTSREECLIR